MWLSSATIIDGAFLIRQLLNLLCQMKLNARQQRKEKIKVNTSDEHGKMDVNLQETIELGTNT